MAFKCFYEGVYIRYRTSGKIINVRRLSAKSRTSPTLIKDLLYADGRDIFIHTEEVLQNLMNGISMACEALALTINLTKTVVM